VATNAARKDATEAILDAAEQLPVESGYASRLVARQRAMYAGPEPFIAKWAAAMRFLDGAVVSLVVTFNLRIVLERLGEVDSGHREMVQLADRLLMTAAKQGGRHAGT
jgi:hypothetical protein